MKIYNPKFAGIEDDQLVRLAQSGDNTAFEELIERHMTSSKRLAMSILRNQEDAEDEVQNACWKAFQHIEGFQQDAKFSTWLSRIVVNQCLMRLRKEKRAKFIYLEAGAENGEVNRLELPDEAPGPEELLGQQEVQAALLEEANRIPPILRDVFILRDVKKRPTQDVAEILGISVAAAKSRLLRARLEMRQRMEKHLGRLGVGTLTA